MIEEALLAVESRKPLFLVGILGGATRQAIDAVEGRTMPQHFSEPGLLQELFAAPPLVETDRRTQSDRATDRTAVWHLFNQIGMAGLAKANRLSREENEELFNSPVLDRVIQLVLTGLSRLRSSG